MIIILKAHQQSFRQAQAPHWYMTYQWGDVGPGSELGSVVRNDGEVDADVVHRIRAGWVKTETDQCGSLR